MKCEDLFIRMERENNPECLYWIIGQVYEYCKEQKMEFKYRAHSKEKSISTNHW